MFLALHYLMILAAILLHIALGGERPAGMIFEAYMFGMAAYVFIKNPNPKHIPLSYLAILTTVILVLGTYLEYKSTTEFSQFSKFARNVRYIIYMCLLVIVGEGCKHNPTKNINLKPFVVVYLGTFLVVYLFQVIVLRESRPRLFSENNFEQPALMIFLYGLYARSLTPLASLIAANVAALLSLSKSALLQIVFLDAKLFLGYKSPLKYALIPAGILLLGLMILFVTSQRSEKPSQKVDRVYFMETYLGIAKDDSLKNLAIGHGIADQLPMWACRKLEFWADIMEGDFRLCTASVLHSFILKALYETGIIGTIITYLLWYLILKRYLSDIGTTTFWIIAICSLSVSGFSNSLIIWPIFSLIFLFNNYKINSKEVKLD